MNTNTPKPYINPYAGCQKRNDEPRRINADADKDEFDFIRLIRPSLGTTVITTNTLWHKLVLELKRRGITSMASKKQFEHFVANCELVLPTEINQNEYDKSVEQYRPNSHEPANGIGLADQHRSPVGGVDQVASEPDDRGTASPTSAIPQESETKPTGFSSRGSRKKKG